MEPVSIYGLAAGGVFLSAFLFCMWSYLSRWVQNRTLFYVLKYLIYPVFIRHNRLFSSFSRWHTLLLLSYWIGTAACNLVGASTVLQIGERAGTLATLHLIPLLFSSRGSFAADLLGISLHTYTRLHKCIGIMALLQSLIHTAIFIIHSGLNLKDGGHFNGFLVRATASR